ncbi:hypothetical protein BDZ94DRAFT_1062974 [Collybia nuda]|uniref:Uncharacterized protein n=1 Tax=Collybia nuda TaxID=64659 RepID=A0A9P5XWJ4_9AGAR|nr:hypothetical protein BDZ94DRAFT_1062974 [Collybia nuda]
MLKAFVVAVSAIASSAAVQTANCSSTGTKYEWSFNLLQQNPCIIVSYLGSVCDPAGFNIPPLPPNQVYLGPLKETTNDCRCSSVFYSLLSMCAFCQRRNYLSWSKYNQNCIIPHLGVFPLKIPDDTAVPFYAYYNVSIDDTFNPHLAEAIADVISGPTTIFLTTTRAAIGPSWGPTWTDPTHSHFPHIPHHDGPPNSRSFNGGSIAGAVVGSIIFISLIALAIYWCIQRRKSERIMTFETDPRKISPFIYWPPQFYVGPSFKLCYNRFDEFCDRILLIETYNLLSRQRPLRLTHMNPGQFYEPTPS